MAAIGVLRPDEERMFEGQPKGFPISGFKVEDVMLPEGDDMGILSDEEEEEAEEIQAESGFQSIIVVDNLPVVGPEKRDKLLGVLRKIYTQAGTIREGGLVMPEDPVTKQSKGFAFIEFTTPQEAALACSETNGYALDKRHSFVVSMFDDFQKYEKVADVYVPPPTEPFCPQTDLMDWLLDKRGRDQFIIRYNDETEVLWNDPARSAPELVYQRTDWTESFVQWSPRGTMLATLHTKGIALWGGENFGKLQRVYHPGVRLVEFSPCERYITSYSTADPKTPRDKATVQLIMFDIRSGKKMRVFEGSVEEYAVGAAAGTGGTLKWPVFKWAGGPQDKYFARLIKNGISVYEAPEAVLLDKKSLKLEGVQDFAWSPAEPILAAYQTEQSGGNLPARLVLIRIPDRTELRQKNLFSVSDVCMHWQPQGDSLAVQVDRYTKTKKSTYTSFELFSLKDKDIPMEVLELPNKGDKVFEFAWEPKGHRFAVLHGETAGKPSVSVYGMKDMKSSTKGVALLGTLVNQPANTLLWSPQGKNILLAALRGAVAGSSINLQFFNVDEFEMMNSGEHFSASDAEWDPTGRFVASSATANGLEPSYIIWTFNGQQCYRVPCEGLLQFNWRPRPASLLTPDQEREILKNLKKYSKRYEEEDASIGFEEDFKIRQERERLLAEWTAWEESVMPWVETLERGKRELLGDKYRGEEEYTVEEVEVTQVVEVKEEAYKG